MKLKFLLSIFAILFLSVFATYASFPVQKTTENTTISSTTSKVEKSKDAYLLLQLHLVIKANLLLFF